MSSSDGAFDELGDIEGKREHVDDYIDLQKIKIGRKYVVYRANDPIFKLTEPVGPNQTDEKCIFCERNMKDLEKKYCGFCSHVACQRCCHKKQKFQLKPG